MLGEGQSAELDLCCGTGCWGEGQLVCGARPVLWHWMLGEGQLVWWSSHIVLICLASFLAHLDVVSGI